MIENYVKLLEGISYRDWIRLKIGMDRFFEQQKCELESELKLADTNIVLKLILSQFGQT